MQYANSASSRLLCMAYRSPSQYAEAQTPISRSRVLSIGLPRFLTNLWMASSQCPLRLAHTANRCLTRAVDTQSEAATQYRRCSRSSNSASIHARRFQACTIACSRCSASKDGGVASVFEGRRSCAMESSIESAGRHGRR